MTRSPALVLLVCYLLATASMAWGDMQVIGYVTGAQTAEDVAQLDDTAFTPLRDGQSLGFVNGPIWVKLDLDAAPDQEPVFLTIRPNHLDRIAVYDSQRPQTPFFMGGDSVASPPTFIRNGYTVPLSRDLSGGSLLVRLDSHNLMQPSFGVMRLNEILRLEHILSIVFTVALSATLFYLLWALSAAFLHPSVLLGSYVLRLTCYLMVLFVHSGTWRVLTSGETLAPQDVAHNLSALCYISFAQIFDYVLLRELRGRWWQRLFLATVVAFSLAKSAAFAGGSVALALQLNNLSALVTLFLGTGAAIAAQHAQSGSFRISRTAVGLYFILQALPLLVLILADQMESAHFRALQELALINYSILPGAYVTYLLFQRQRRVVHEQRMLAEQRNALQATAEIEIAKRREISDLLAMLTHEVKTPLAMLQMAQTIGEMDEKLVGKAAGTIKHILQQCDRVDEIENGQLTVEMAPIDLTRALRNASEDTRVSVEVVSCPAAQVDADPSLLQIVLQNLLYNAQKYHRQGTPITAEITQDETEIELRLANLCRSNTMPDPKRMFDKYYRHSGATAQSGTGLGLYIVSQLCNRMAVTVHAEIVAERVILVLRFARATKIYVSK